VGSDYDLIMGKCLGSCVWKIAYVVGVRTRLGMVIYPGGTDME